MSRILFLAPQPFFQERGTPIAVRLAATVIAKNGKRAVDLVTYHEGDPIEIPGVELHRIKAPTFLSGVGPGLSMKKLCCDVLFTLKAFNLAWRNRHNQYTLVHAVEESVFIACLLKWCFGIPFLYDMDSSLALQVTEKWGILKPLRPLFDWMERLAIRQSHAVVPVCDALAVIAEGHGARKTTTLYDISLLEETLMNGSSEDLTATCGLPATAQLVLYIGNLERYQGIDLLIESFSTIHDQTPNSAIVIIGGSAQHQDAYRSLAERLGIAEKVFLVGPRPVSHLAWYLAQATVLASPRILGNNTPMKIYSYLHSKIALLATRLPTHTQVLTDEVAMLAEPTPQSFGKAMLTLLKSPEVRDRLAQQAFAVAEQRYTFERFEEKLNSIYDEI